MWPDAVFFLNFKSLAPNTFLVVTCSVWYLLLICYFLLFAAFDFKLELLRYLGSTLNLLQLIQPVLSLNLPFTLFRCLHPVVLNNFGRFLWCFSLDLLKQLGRLSSQIFALQHRNQYFPSQRRPSWIIWMLWALPWQTYHKCLLTMLVWFTHRCNWLLLLTAILFLARFASLHEVSLSHECLRCWSPLVVITLISDLTGQLIQHAPRCSRFVQHWLLCYDEILRQYLIELFC